MSIRIALDKPPEFYTNLDFVSGRVLLYLQRPETIGNVIVKLEGESRTARVLGRNDSMLTRGGPADPQRSGDIISENHKILYRVFQTYPDDGVSLALQPGQHDFKFNFKIPLNNICHDLEAMRSLMGVAGPNSSGMLGMGGFRTMDGTKQLMLQHVKSTLPPSLTAFPSQAEIRYYIKVTIQRPGLFRENWRYQTGFKFQPIEPPRPPQTRQEAFARRPFTFGARSTMPSKRSIFGSKAAASPADGAGQTPPSIEISARIPHPTILTCNEPLPLRLLAKKLVPAEQQVYLTALEIALVGYTEVRVQSLTSIDRHVWGVTSAKDLSIALGRPSDPVGTEFEVPSYLWATSALPNTVSPSFRICNIARRYEIELRLTLSWGTTGTPRGGGFGGGVQPQVLTLPLKLSSVQVYSGIKPPSQLLQSLANNPPQAAAAAAPRPPPRPSGAVAASSSSSSTAAAGAAPQRQQQTHDPLYPPQLGPGDDLALHDAPPPSYDEAMADQVAGPRDRPAYSGVTAENAPSTMPPEKPGLH
ncbi:hypothetical protein GGR56DRAFT_697241 [Xylariaceae sp. FL0804]|nr:hypothetical protein GGR56DRAFT_697241 [Xylariaceae sp. FL0804]